jgi:CRISPR-associated protein Cas2
LALHLIAYDIADPKRLNRIARFMTKHAIRVQYSVFVADLDRAELEELLHELEGLIDLRLDDVRAYPLPLSGEVALMGRQIFPEDIMLLRNGYNILHLNAEKLPYGGGVRK